MGAPSGRAWHAERDGNTRRNRSEKWEHIQVGGYTRSDGTVVKGYTRRPPIR